MTREPDSSKPWIAAVALGAFISCGAATNSPVLFADKPFGIVEPAPAPIVCWTESNGTPRPIVSHFLRFDLSSPDYEVFAGISRDRDGDGPAEADLEDPQELFAEHGAIAAVNANAFKGLPDAKGETNTDWFAHRPVDIIGLAVADGIMRSPPDPGHTAFWIDPEGRAHVDQPGKNAGFRQGISDWSGVLLDKGIEVPAQNDKLHPRTMLGVDRSGRRLLLVVTDGRQPGYSEGIGLREAAAVMKEHGCYKAICLDGGGSSIMLVAELPGQKPRTINRPAGKAARPVPVLLGIRPRLKDGGER